MWTFDCWGSCRSAADAAADILFGIVRGGNPVSIVDICSGSGAVTLEVVRRVAKPKKYTKQCTSVVCLFLSDLYPQVQSFIDYQKVRQPNLSQTRVLYFPQSFDIRDHCSSHFASVRSQSLHIWSLNSKQRATNSKQGNHADKSLRFVRTMFGSMHQFSPDEMREILSSSVKATDSVVFFDLTNGSLFSALLIVCTMWCTVWFGSLFIKPFSWKRLFWTYVIPVVPVICMHDVIVLCRRTYSEGELQAMVTALDRDRHYSWTVRSQRSGFVTVRALVGYPKTVHKKRK